MALAKGFDVGVELVRGLQVAVAVVLPLPKQLVRVADALLQPERDLGQ